MPDQVQFAIRDGRSARSRARFLHPEPGFSRRASLLECGKLRTDVHVLIVAHQRCGGKAASGAAIQDRPLELAARAVAVQTPLRLASNA